VQQNSKTLRYLTPVRLGDVADMDMETEAKALDRAQDSADRVFVNIFPDTCYELLSAWERVYGLTPDADASTGVRVAALLAKIRAKGGLSRPHFIALAEMLGYDVEIEEPTEFMAGWSCAGDKLNDENIVYAWWANVLNTEIPGYYFYAGTNGAGDRLADFGVDDLETIFEDLKPAETLVFFTYPNF
jgi:uncharacterized protein YmfQ (DUF2313 family)